MRLIKGSVIALVLAGLVVLVPTGVFARGSGHFAAGHGGGHLGGFAGHSSGFHGGGHDGAHNWHGSPYWNLGWWGGDPYWDVSPYYSYYDDNSSVYPEAAPLQYGATDSRDSVMAVQQKLARLGYYRGAVDGIMGPQTRQAIRSFQSVGKLPVTGLVDGATLKALQIS